MGLEEPHGYHTDMEPNLNGTNDTAAREDLLRKIIAATNSDGVYPDFARFRAQLPSETRRLADDMVTDRELRRYEGRYVPSMSCLSGSRAPEVRELVVRVGSAVEVMRGMYREDPARQWTPLELAGRLGASWTADQAACAVLALSDPQLGIVVGTGPDRSRRSLASFSLGERVLDVHVGNGNSDAVVAPAALGLGSHTIGLFKAGICIEHVPLNLLREAHKGLDDDSEVRHEIAGWSRAAVGTAVDRDAIANAADAMSRAAHGRQGEGLGQLRRLSASRPGLVTADASDDEWPLTTAPVVLALAFERLSLVVCHRSTLRICQEP